MDVLRFATSEVYPIGPRTARKFSILILSTLIGCSWPGSKPISPAPEQSVAQIAHTAEQIRGLAFKRQIKLSDRLANSSATEAAPTAYPDGENLIIAWLSAWDGERDAQRFYGAFQTVLERRHRLRFEAAARPQDGLKADLRTGRSMILQVRGSVVLLLDGMTATRALETSENIWKELEIRTEPPSFPFETAKGPTHRSLMSR